LVSGNVIAPTAFHLIDPESNPTETHRLRLVATGGVVADELDRHRDAVAIIAPGPLAQERSMRLTARGRLVVALAAVAVALGIAVGAWFGAAGADSAPAATPIPAQVVVHDGDTLWSIASAVAPGRDPRATVERLRRINGLGSADLAAGQVLRLR
jgi:hypothetical protein